MRKTFAVGRMTPDTTEIVVLDPEERVAAPFPGPWTLRARISRRPRSTGPVPEAEGPATIH